MSLIGVLIQGHKKPEDRDPAKAPVSESMFAAAELAAATRPGEPETRDEVQAEITALTAPEPPAERDEPRAAARTLALRSLAAAPV